MTNKDVVIQLRNMAAAYQMLGENRFKIIAYERAAESIERLTAQLSDLWKKNELRDIPGIGGTIAGHLHELFETGKVEHFEKILGEIPEAVFPLLQVTGIGPKKAYKIVKELKLKNAKTVISDVEKAAKNGKIRGFSGFGEKSEQDIIAGIAEYKEGQTKRHRSLIDEADAVAYDVEAHLKKIKEVKHVDTLGSLRRRAETIGDIDLAVSTTKPELVIDHFMTYSHQKLIERGPTGASLLLHNGKQVDLRVQTPDAYGAMLQYFTGSKSHNIRLRERALKMGKSLNEYGIKDVKTKKLTKYATEKSFYEAIGMPWITPELREDRGEVPLEGAVRLPELVDHTDMQGDLHVHTSYDLTSSHDVGEDPIEAILDAAHAKGYQYLGISDHNPRVSGHTAEQIADIMKKRYAFYTKAHAAWAKKSGSTLKLFVMCEVDIQPDGSLALPIEAFEHVDAVIVSIHSSFKQDMEVTTTRIVRALTAHPKVRIMGHPSGRLVGKREPVRADWPEVFALCKKKNIALEINAHPKRLDLSDALVYEAVRAGVKLVIDTDAHSASGLDVMPYGVSVARRGWATKHDILNTLGYNQFNSWLTKGAT